MQTSNMDFVHWMKQANDASISFFNVPINNFPHVDIRSSNAVHSVASKKVLSDSIRIDLPAPRKVQSVGITFINRQHPIDKSRKLVQKGSITSMCWSKSEQFLATCSSSGDIKIWNVNDWSLVGELLGDHCSTDDCQTELQDLHFAHNDTHLIAAGGKRHIAPCLHDSEEEPFIQVFNIQSLSSSLVNSATSFTINVPHLQNASISCLKMLEVEDNCSYFVTIGTDGCILKWKLDPVTRDVSHAEIELPSKLHQAQHVSCEVVVSDSEVCLAIVATEDLYIVTFNTGKVVHTFKNVVGRLATKLDLIEPYAANVHHMVLVPETTAREEVSVLYSKDYNRFFLRLDDFFYPLMRRLPVVGMNKNDGSSSRVYCFPGHNGFWYNLRVNCYGSSQGLENFESILQEYTKFSWKGEAHHGRVEQSPDDKLVRRTEKEVQQTSEKDIKQTQPKKTETEGETETKNLTSRREPMDLRDIKYRNFRKEAKSTIGKNFIETEKKGSQDFINLRKSNLNMSLSKSLEELLKTTETQVPSLYLPKEELEDAILDFREFSTHGNIRLEDISEEVTKSSLANSTKGLEILFFEDAQLQKCKDRHTSIAGSGALSVLYFKSYRRFFLCLDNWFYPLMRRLPVVGMDKTDGSSSRLYCLPGPDGYCYNLRVNCYGSPEALENFESILQDCTKFSWKGEAHKGRDESPGDHLTRKTTKEETTKKGLKRKPIESGERLSEEFQNLRRINLNRTMPKTFFDLTQTPETQVPSLYFSVQEVEDAILDYRDVATKANFNMVNITEQTASKESNLLKGLEILFFEDVQLQKGKGDQSSIAACGPLSVLYFKDLNRFFLCLDDWVYPLMKRLPLIGLDKTDGSSSRLYCLPGTDGSCYYLRVNCYGSPQGLENFESILEDCSKFAWRGESHKGREQSPDDKLTRKNIKEEQIKKDFQSRLNKETLQSDFLNLRRTNLNIILPRAFQDLVKTKESKVPSLFFPRDELEEIILNYRDLSQGNLNLGEQKPGFIETIQQRFHDIKESIFGTAERGRETMPEDKSRGQISGITEIPPN